MNSEPIAPPADPRALATAYALGELTADELTAFEQQMETDPALAALARETKDFCTVLDSTLRDPVATLAEENRAALIAAAGTKRRKSVIWIPWLAGAAAACVAGGIYLQPHNRVVETKPDASQAANPALITEAEMNRREALLLKAQEAEQEGDRLFAAQDFAGAIERYRYPLDTLPANTVTSPDLARATAKYANASVIHAGELGKRGEFEKAKTLLGSVLNEKVAPNHPGAQRLLKLLDDPEHFNLEQVQNVAANQPEIDRLFKRGLGFVELGQFNEAQAEFNHILAIDPYNRGARRQLEKTERELTNYYKSARDHSRVKMLNDVDAAWAVAVPSEAKTPLAAPIVQPKPLVAAQTVLPNVTATTPASPQLVAGTTPMMSVAQGTGGGSGTGHGDGLAGLVGAGTGPGSGDRYAFRGRVVEEKAQLSETARDYTTPSFKAYAIDGEGMTVERGIFVPAEHSLTPGYESYKPTPENPFFPVLKAPLSTFSIDVDTASYSNVRRYLNMNQAPPPEAVRLEELVNYFPYDYAQPVDGKPFAVHVEMTSAPWDETHRLARIALKGKEIAQGERPAANLVFLVDVSGSMQPENKLPLVKQSLKFVVERLTEKDTVSLVTYAGESGVALPATSGADKARIMAAIEGLGAGGSTNGAGGIGTAYAQAAKHFHKEGINRVVLATDGDFNVGVTSHEELLKLITEKAKTGVFLSVLGYGMGNTKDDTMELLADKGNGNYAYIDSLSEARKTLADQFSGTLVTIAKDVKIQIEFNPAIIRSYRLLGYENRMLAKEDFKNDKKDAGEIGAGHTVTAIYELIPAGAPEPQVVGDDLKYQPKPAEPAPAPPAAPAAGNGETMTVKLRWKAPDADVSQEMAVPVKDTGAKIAEAGPETKWAVAVAGFAAMLNNSQFNGLTWDQIRTLAKAGKGADPNGYRGEFLQLLDRAESVRK